MNKLERWCLRLCGLERAAQMQELAEELRNDVSKSIVLRKPNEAEIREAVLEMRARRRR